MVRCIATAKSGEQCRTNALASGLCVYHDPTIMAAELRRAGAVKGGSSPRVKSAEHRAVRYSAPPVTPKQRTNAAKELDGNLRTLRDELAAEGITVSMATLVRDY